MENVTWVGDVSGGGKVVAFTPPPGKPLKKGRGTVPMTPIPRKTPTMPAGKKGH
jgi:hypothetical protein